MWQVGRRVTPRAARQLGIAPAPAVNSCRKWDKHGDYHMFADLARVLFWGVFSCRRIDEHIQRYWYEK